MRAFHIVTFIFLIAQTGISQETYDFNPLQIGNVWKYRSLDPTNSNILIRYIPSDTIVNGQMYFKKIDYETNYKTGKPFFTFERNDSLKGCTYLLDVEDLDNDGLYNDELLLDSLNVDEGAEYQSYRFVWNEYFSIEPGKVEINNKEKDLVFGDSTVTLWAFYYRELISEVSADMIGIIKKIIEGPEYILKGAVVNGSRIGETVGIESSEQIVPKYLLLSFKNKQIYKNDKDGFNEVVLTKYIWVCANRARVEHFTGLANPLTSLSDKGIL